VPPPPRDFLEHVAALAPIFCAPQGGSEFLRPSGWQNIRLRHLDAVLSVWKPGMALCAVTGERLAVVDVDPRNGGDVGAVAQALDGLDVRVFAEVDTPGGGRHFYVAGHPELMSCHLLAGFPGVDVQSHGANVFLPGTRRPKYDGGGYTVLADSLATLHEAGDPHGARNLVDWVSSRRAQGAVQQVASSPPWDGTPPAARAVGYLRAALTGEAAQVAATPTGRRNDQLFVSAMKLGSYIAGAGLDEREAVTALLDAATTNGEIREDGETAVLATIRSGLRTGKTNPRAVPTGGEAVALIGEHQSSQSSHETAVTALTADVDAPRDVAGMFPRLDLVSLLSADRPPREWVVEGLVPAGASVALVAPAGTGKSLLLLAMMIAVARGDRTFAGLRVKRRRVLLIDMENTEDDLAERLRDLGVTHQNAAYETEELVFIHLPPLLRPLDTQGGAEDLEGMLDCYGFGPGDVVVLDSFQRVITGAENDSDTMRAFYRHTGARLKQRKLTVVRTDNTGKDADKGARGSSGKRDDVDVELLLTVDPKRKGCLRIVPGKQRIPDAQSVIVEQSIDEDGQISYSTAGDPHRTRVAEVIRLLDGLGMDADAGQRPAHDAIKRMGRDYSREIVRAAVKERKARACADPPPRT